MISYIQLVLTLIGVVASVGGLYYVYIIFQRPYIEKIAGWKVWYITKFGEFKPLPKREFFYNKFMNDNSKIYSHIREFNENRNRLQEKMNEFANEIKSHLDFIEEIKGYENFEMEILSYIINKTSHRDVSAKLGDFWKRNRTTLLKFWSYKEFKIYGEEIEFIREKLISLLENINLDLKNILDKYREKYRIAL